MVEVEFEFKDDAYVSSDDPHYDLFNGGYIKPAELLKRRDDVLMVEEAVSIVRQFLQQAEDAEVLELR